MSVSIFLPTRRDSQRIPKKNTRRFADFNGGLLELKLNQLLKIDEVDEIILSTNDEESLEMGETFKKNNSKLKLIERPDFLATSETDLSKLIQYASEVASSEHILWTHVTSPFCDENVYREVISIYYKKLLDGSDSLVGVQRFKNFLWNREINDIINRVGTRRWPNTQNLKELFEINNAIFLAPKTLYENKKDRVGERPFLFEMKKIPSLDIDEEEDFLIAEAVYGSLFK